MKIFIKVKPRSREPKIEKIDDNNFIIYVKEPPEKGKANKAVIELLAEYFKISKSRIIITKGTTSKQKIVEIV